VAANFSLKFLGVRAIHSSPGQKNQTTGGNTSCIEIYDGTHTVFINAGFGINFAGDLLFAKYLKTKSPVNTTILFSDFLWDSILGLPFFTPIHFRSTEVDILTGIPIEHAQAGLNDASSPLFSPFNGIEGFLAAISIRTVDSAMTLGAWTINALAMPHPLTPYPVTVWRLTHDSGLDIGIVMLADTDKKSRDAIAGFLDGCTTLICAASTSPRKDGWDRHRTGFTDALAIGLQLGVRDLYLTQFHPDMTDVLLQRELLKLQATVASKITGGDPNAANLKIHLGSEASNAIVPAISRKLKRTA
jgi:hypothetical protein